MRRPRGGNAMNTRESPSPGAELSREAKQSPTGGETGGGKAAADRHEGACRGFKAVYQRQRLLISGRGRSSESRPGENPMSGLMREPEES
jgi:hypothetical protein